MLKDQDRIFKNLYNDLGEDVSSAQKRGDWIDTKEICHKGREWIINEIKTSELRGRGALIPLIKSLEKNEPIPNGVAHRSNGGIVFAENHELHEDFSGDRKSTRLNSSHT